MATIAGASGDEPPDPEKWGGWKPSPPDKQFVIRRKPVPAPKQKDTQKNNNEQVGQSFLAATSASGPSSRTRQQTNDSVEQVPRDRYAPGVVAPQSPPTRQSTSEGGAHGERMLTLQQRDDHGSLQRNNSRASSLRSGVSDLHRFEIDHLEEMRKLGMPSPAISVPSRPNSTENRTISERRSGLTLQTTMPSRPDILRGMPEESTRTRGSGTRRGVRKASSVSQPPEDINGPTSTSIRRQERSRCSESPYKEGQTSYPLSPQRHSEGSPLQQSELGDAFENDTSGWVPNSVRRRDTVKAGAEGWVPDGCDIDSASGSVLAYASDPQRSPERREGVQQLYCAAAANPEIAAPTTTGRSRSNGNEETIEASIMTADTRSMATRVSDSTAITPSSSSRSYATSSTGRPLIQRTSSGPRVPVPTAQIELRRGTGSRWYGPQDSRRRSDVPRMPVREGSPSSIEAESCSGLFSRKRRNGSQT